jgi:hypothetical protein
MTAVLTRVESLKAVGAEELADQALMKVWTSLYAIYERNAHTPSARRAITWQDQALLECVKRELLQTAQEIGEALLRLAQCADAPVLAVIAHYVFGVDQACLHAGRRRTRLLLGFTLGDPG